MNTFALAVLASIAMIELLHLCFRFNFWQACADSLEQCALTFSEVDNEREQERLIISAALNLLGLLAYLLTLLSILLVVVIALPHYSGLKTAEFVWMCSGSTLLYAWLRSVLTKQVITNSNLGYGRLVRWLHWLALELNLARQTSFELEKALYLRKARQSVGIADEPVYVMGLARSGTTITLEVLEKTGMFHSSTYRDMPFALSPNLWKRLTKFSRVHAQPLQRAHGDGLAIEFDSPECFEEIFWRTECKLKKGTSLAYCAPTAESVRAFTDYRQLCVLSGLDRLGDPRHKPQHAIRYLSKNNNNVMRIKELSDQHDARLVLIFRDPMATAWSLYQQHLRFCEIQTDDIFARAYMRWLGHHEFGLGHKPLASGIQYLEGLNPAQPDYWLAYWLGSHEYLWQTYKELPRKNQAGVAWFSHERMCNTPESELSRLFKFANIQLPPNVFAQLLKPAGAKPQLEKQFSNSLLERARSLHRMILESTNHE